MYIKDKDNNNFIFHSRLWERRPNGVLLYWTNRYLWSKTCL